MGQMVASLASGVAMGVGWCFCTAMGSLCNACCGNDKPSTVAPSLSSGRKRSALLLLLSVALALIFQHVVSPALSYDRYGDTIDNIPYVGQYLLNTWTDGCQSEYETKAAQDICRGNAGVYRVSFATTLTFILLALAAKCKPTFNREAWPAKYTMFLFFVFGTVWIPNTKTFIPIYMQIARIGGAMFIVMQIIILIDLAYNWNESWVLKSDEAESEESGSGKKWLGAILFSAVMLYALAFTAVGLMFAYFKGCPVNTTFVSLTLVFIVASTAIQLSGEEASLLTSATIAAYGSYLCYASISRNPNGDCNPRLGDPDVTGTVIGICLTLVSLAWTGYSATAEQTLASQDSAEDGMSSSFVTGSGGDENVKGIVMGSNDLNNNPNYGSSGSPDSESGAGADASAKTPAATWQINIVLTLVSCWYAMVLTGWGTIEGTFDGESKAANPEVSHVSMWMIIAAQWLCFAMYAWTIMAPRLFPDRDFS